MQAKIEVGSVEHRQGDILCTLADGKQVWEKGLVATVKAKPVGCTGELKLDISAHRAPGHDAVNAEFMDALRAGGIEPGKQYLITFTEVSDGHEEAPPGD